MNEFLQSCLSHFEQVTSVNAATYGDDYVVLVKVGRLSYQITEFHDEYQRTPYRVEISHANQSQTYVGDSDKSLGAAFALAQGAMIRSLTLGIEVQSLSHEEIVDDIPFS